MSDEHKAVFLSYASQDADAAKRICDALRQAGIEVWFDQSELVGGDQWDQKIRKQIKECALLIPIISAATQARTEGYFRLEWRLADQRTHLMAKGRAFLLPIVIDDTRDTDAHVPDSFTEVQWTRLPGGETSPAFVLRVKKLLGGEAAPASSRPSEQDAGTLLASRAALLRRRIAWWWIALAVLAVGAGTWVGLKPKTPTTASIVAPSVSGQLMHFATSLTDDVSPERSNAAAESADRLIVAEPGNAEAWAASSLIETWRVVFGYDTSEAQREKANVRSLRALQVDPRSYAARLARAGFLVMAGEDAPLWAEGEQMLRQLLTERPGDQFASATLATCLKRQGRLAEAGELYFQIGHYPAASWSFLGAGDYDRAEEAARRAVAARRFTQNFSVLSAVQARGREDLDAAQATLDQIPASELLDDYAAATVFQLRILRREPEKALDVIRRVPRDWLSSLAFTGPKAMLTGSAHFFAGRQEAARAEWRLALQQVEQRLVAHGNQPTLLRHKAHLLASLGEREAVRPVVDLLRELAGREAGDLRGTFDIELLLGRNEVVLDWLEKALREPEAGRTDTLHMTARYSPIFDPLRGDPRFEKLLRETLPKGAKPFPEQKTEDGGQQSASFSLSPSTSPNAKSIVVLPFTNLSGDKEQEYFSDGLTEEILNALARERDLRVVPRTSAFSFKGKNLPLPEIARALNVAQVIDGSVRRAGNQVRINCTLTRVADGFTESLPTFTKEMKDAGDIFALQDEVAGAVVERLTQRKAIAARAAVVTQVPEAYDAYMQGRQLLAETSPSWDRAVTALNRAVKLDPQFALAWAVLGRAHAQLYSIAAPASLQSLNLPAGRAAVEMALRLQPNLAEAHLALALVLSSDGTNLAAALQELNLAEKSRPDNSDIIFVRGQIAMQRGQRGAAIDLVRRAARLDPRNGSIANYLGNFLRMDGRYDEAEKAYALAFEILGSSIPLTNQAINAYQMQGNAARITRLLDAVPAELRLPGYWLTRQYVLYALGDLRGSLSAAETAAVAVTSVAHSHLFAARAHEELGDLAEAERLYRTVLVAAEMARAEMPTSLRTWSLLALTYAGLGRKDDALAAANKGLELVPPEENPFLASGSGGVAPYLGYAALAQVKARFGMTDEALAIVQAQADAGWWRRHYLLLSPDWNLLRKDPRFRAIAEKAPL